MDLGWRYQPIMPIVQPTMTPEAEEAAWQAGLCPPHRWRIAAHSGGPESEGICVRCQARKKFTNVLDPARSFYLDGPTKWGAPTSLSTHAEMRRQFYAREE